MTDEMGLMWIAMFVMSLVMLGMGLDHYLLHRRVNKLKEQQEPREEQRDGRL